MNYSDISEIEIKRFWSYVDKNGPIHPALGQCWQWTGYANSYGYGYLSVKDGPLPRKRKNVPAHRISYFLIKEEMPAHLQADHLCRNRRCVNPDHLEPVTGKINVLRGFGPCGVNGRKTHCIHGHAFETNNLYIDKSGFRCCRECQRQKMRKRRANLKAQTGGNP